MEKIYNFLFWLKERLSEPSSWTWIIVLAGYFGYTFNPELLEYIGGVVVSLVALIQFIKSDKVEVKESKHEILEESKSELPESSSENQFEESNKEA